jgi:hypothetical protein
MFKEFKIMVKRIQQTAGFTITELILAISISSIMIFAVGAVMLDTQRGWVDTYAKVHGGAAGDAMMAKTAFDRIVRKASRSIYGIGGAEDITVYYYNHWLLSSTLDRYARFYRSADTPSEMYVQHGQVDGAGVKTMTHQVLLASNVIDLEFRPMDGGIEMKLALDDGREATTVVTAAILHNE